MLNSLSKIFWSDGFSNAEFSLETLWLKNAFHRWKWLFPVLCIPRFIFLSQSQTFYFSVSVKICFWIGVLENLLASVSLHRTVDEAAFTPVANIYLWRSVLDLLGCFLIFRKRNLYARGVVNEVRLQFLFLFDETVLNCFQLLFFLKTLDFPTPSVAAIFLTVIDVCSLKVTILELFLGVISIATNLNNLRLLKQGETNWVENANLSNDDNVIKPD